jgi:hypothetical protein
MISIEIRANKALAIARVGIFLMIEVLWASERVAMPLLGTTDGIVSLGAIRGCAKQLIGIMSM